MGGSKNQSPAQKDKVQKRGNTEQNKTKKSKPDDSKTATSVLINESQAIKYINDAKARTVQDLARHTTGKISTDNLFLQKLLTQGIVKRVGGFSGHHIYQAVSE